jgi:hypothetical protein
MHATLAGSAGVGILLAWRVPGGTQRKEGVKGCVWGTIGIRLAQAFFSRLGVHPDPKILDDLVRRKEHGISASQNMLGGALAQVI